MADRDALLALLLDTSTKRHAYQTDAMFHLLIDNLVETLPEVVTMLVSGAAAREADRRERVDAIMAAGPPLDLAALDLHEPRAGEIRSPFPLPPWA